MNILIVGLGSIARKHIAALRGLKIDFKIYAFRSTHNVETEDGIENIFDIDENSTVFDFAIISNPTHLHFEFIEKLTIKGINLFIEKPAIHTLDNHEKLIQLVDEKKIKTYVACNLRFHPCIKYLKNKLINDNLIINEVNVYCGSYLPEWRTGRDFNKIYSANANMGGGVHLDLFHELDYVTWLFGYPTKSCSIKRSVSSLSINSIDYANYILEYTNFTANIVLNYYRKKAKRTIELVLDNQIITADLINNIISDENNRVLYKYSDLDLNETYNNQMEYFVTSLKQNEKPLNSLKDSIDILKIVLLDA